MMVQAQQEQGEDEAINEENVPTHSNDPLLSGEDRLKLEELMALCTSLQNRVLDLELTKTTQALEIDSLKRRVKKLEKKQRSRTHGLRRLYKVGRSRRVESFEDSLGDQEDALKQGRIADIDADEDITLENVHDTDMFGVNDLDGDEVFIEKEALVEEVSAVGTATIVSATTITKVDITLAQALTELKSAKPKARTTVATTITADDTRPRAKGLAKVQDKGKGIMVEEHLKMKKKDQVLFNKQEAIRLQAQFDKEARIEREKEEANAALIEQWNDIHDKVEIDYELAQRLQAEKQEELTIEEKSKLFVQLLEAKKKHFAAKRVEEKRNRPPTKAQQRSFMCTYLKNMDGWKPKDLKNKSFANIQDLFGKDMKRVNIFVDMETELVEGEELESDKSKKQKLDEKVEAEVDDAKEAKELKQCLEIVPDDVTIDATPLSVKIPIVDYKIYQEGKKSFFKIIRADGKTQMYLTFTKMLKNVDREDLETMFEHHVEDSIWKNQQGLVKVLNLKLFDSCGVHCVTMQSIPYYLFVEKMYPLTKHTLHQMFNDVKLQVDYECEMTYELLRLVKKQLKAGYLVLLVQKLLLLVFKVSTADGVTTVERLQMLKDKD
ncbi:hypothetical protein Tco_1418867 [Tanacetum coccineum]